MDLLIVCILSGKTARWSRRGSIKTQRMGGWRLSRGKQLPTTTCIAGIGSPVVVGRIMISLLRRTALLLGKRTIRVPEGHSINGTVQHWPLYPPWAILVTPRNFPKTEKERLMTMWQESIRKEVERLFRCFQGHFKLSWHELFDWSDE